MMQRSVIALFDHVSPSVVQIAGAIGHGSARNAPLDFACRLIGVNTAIMSPAGASAGIGFWEKIWKALLLRLTDVAIRERGGIVLRFGDKLNDLRPGFFKDRLAHEKPHMAAGNH